MRTPMRSQKNATNLVLAAAGAVALATSAHATPPTTDVITDRWHVSPQAPVQDGHPSELLLIETRAALAASRHAPGASSDAPIEQWRVSDDAFPEDNHQTGLVNGVPVEDISLETDGLLAFYIDVPPDSGHLMIETSGGTGDVDIYVGFEVEPTLEEFDCVGWLAGNDELCWFPIPDAGRYNILLHAYEAIEGVQLEARFSDERPEVQPLVNGEPAPAEVAAGAMSYYSFVVEEGSSDLVVEMRGGPDTTGDAELYVRYGAPPVQDEFYWDCRPWIDGNDETCTFPDPEPGLWYAGVEAWHEFEDVTDVTIMARWTVPATDVPGQLQVLRTGAHMRPVYQLSWNGGTEVIDVWLNGTLVHQGPNEGSYSRRLYAWERPATWQVCNSDTTDCSPELLAR